MVAATAQILVRVVSSIVFGAPRSKLGPARRTPDR